MIVDALFTLTFFLGALLIGAVVVCMLIGDDDDV